MSAKKSDPTVMRYASAIRRCAMCDDVTFAAAAVDDDDDDDLSHR